MTTKNSNNNLDCIAGRQSLVLLLLYGFVHVNEDEEMHRPFIGVWSMRGVCTRLLHYFLIVQHNVDKERGMP